MSNLLDPAILFFVFGVFAGSVKSNLEIPSAIAKFLSLYLLMALGLKGGFALAATGLSADIALSLLVAVKGRLAGFDAAAVAASYGSVSAVTFVTATQYLSQNGIEPNNYMAVALVIMESPAIIMAVLLANALRRQAGAQGPSLSIGKILHESFTDGAHLLLLGAMAPAL